MNEFLEYPTIFPDSVALICENLSLTDIKALSLVSQEWFDATSGILSDRSIFHPTDPEYLKNFQRNFKNFTVSDGSSEDINHFLDNLIFLLSRKRKIEEESQIKYKKYQIESLRFENVSLNSANISKLTKLQTLVVLEFIWCTFEVDEHKNFDFSSLKLQTFKLDLDKEIDFFYVIKILMDNKDTLKTFHFTTSKLNMNDTFIEGFQFPLLEEFYCKSTVYTWNFSGIERFFQKHPGLKRCFLDGSFIESHTANAIKANCSGLEELSLERATSAQLEHVPSMKNLKSLSISGPQINKISLLNLRDLNLKKLSVHIHKSGGINMKTIDFVTFLGGLKNLTEVDFSNSDKLLRVVKTGILFVLSTCCPLLEKINLSGNQSLSQPEDLKGIKEFQNLKILNLYNTGLKDAILTAISCPMLREVNLGETDIKSEVFQNFISRTPFLEVLKFRGSRWISDKDVLFLGEHQQFFRILELQDCTRLTFKSLEYLMKETLFSEITVSILPSATPLEDFVKIREGFVQKMNYFNTLLLSNGYRNIWVFLNDNLHHQWIKVKFQ